MFSKNSPYVLSANSSSNSIATVRNSSKFCILDSASTEFSSSRAFVYPDLFNVSFINSEMLNSFCFVLNSSIKLIKSSAFDFKLFNPNCTAFFIT